MEDIVLVFKNKDGCFYVKPKYTYVNVLAKIYITPSPCDLFAEVCGMKKIH
jgi:hypothetical protein